MNDAEKDVQIIEVIIDNDIIRQNNIDKDSVDHNLIRSNVFADRFFLERNNYVDRRYVLSN